MKKTFLCGLNNIVAKHIVPQKIVLWIQERSREMIQRIEHIDQARQRRKRTGLAMKWHFQDLMAEIQRVEMLQVSCNEWHFNVTVSMADRECMLGHALCLKKKACDSDCMDIGAKLISTVGMQEVVQSWSDLGLCVYYSPSRCTIWHSDTLQGKGGNCHMSNRPTRLLNSTTPPLQTIILHLTTICFLHQIWVKQLRFSISVPRWGIVTPSRWSKCNRITWKKATISPPRARRITKNKKRSRFYISCGND